MNPGFDALSVLLGLDQFFLENVYGCTVCVLGVECGVHVYTVHVTLCDQDLYQALD